MCVCTVVVLLLVKPDKSLVCWLVYRRLFMQLVAVAQLPISHLWNWPLLMMPVQCPRNSASKQQLVSHMNDGVDYNVVAVAAADAAADDDDDDGDDDNNYSIVKICSHIQSLNTLSSSQKGCFIETRKAGHPTQSPQRSQPFAAAC